jgi:glycine/D-amino acid oxidase-like deaminating enzyme
VINGKISFWMTDDTITWPVTPTLEANSEFDILIVGAGYSGLWTAYWTLQHSPGTSVGVVEAEHLGFGASGRNGGWLSSKTVGVRRALARGSRGGEGVRRMDDILRRSTDEVVTLLGANKIQARHGGWMQLARSPSEQARIEHYVEESRTWGVGETSLRLLSRAEVRERIRASRVTGAMYSPDGYCVNPALMLRELASRVVESGGHIFSSSRAERIGPGIVTVNGRTVRARTVVVATEAYTVTERGQRRQILPLNSSQIITRPLTEQEWDEIGWDHCEGVSASAHTYFYGQRTPDGRILLGGRGQPYTFASGYDPEGRVDSRTVSKLCAALKDCFPTVDLEPAHAWSGVLGVARDWSPYVERDSSSRLIRVGAYAGQGLTGAYVGGRVAADLVLGRVSEFSQSAWVRPGPARWEPEPLRWIGANALYGAYAIADRLEARRGDRRTSRIAKLADKLARR